MHALIIEDETIIAMAIEDVLRDCGFTSFDIVASPETAIAAATYHCPSLITSDVQLRPGCGIKTVRTILRTVVVRPVIFITGNVAEVMRKVPNSRALSKPFTPQQLSAEVALALA